MGFAEKIYALRTQTGMSQAYLAETLQVSRQTVSKWELGTSYPEIEKLLAISGLFHVTTDYLLKEQPASQESAKLDRLVLRFLGYAQDMDSISGSGGHYEGRYYRRCGESAYERDCKDSE